MRIILIIGICFFGFIIWSFFIGQRNRRLLEKEAEEDEKEWEEFRRSEQC